MRRRTLLMSVLAGAVVLLGVFAYFAYRSGAAPPPAATEAPGAASAPAAAAKPSAPPKSAAGTATATQGTPGGTAVPIEPNISVGKLQSGKAGPAPEDPLSAVDGILSKLDLGNIVFNVPRTINVDDTAIIQLVLGLETPIDTLENRITVAGKTRVTQIRVSDRMEARLSGPGFAITAVTPEVQAVSGSEVTEWKWEIQPKREGRQHLHLTLSVLIDVNGASTPRALRSFDEEIEVAVTPAQRVSAFVADNWQWLWAAILVPIGGWLWRTRRSGS